MAGGFVASTVEAMEDVRTAARRLRETNAEAERLNRQLFDQEQMQSLEGEAADAFHAALRELTKAKTLYADAVQAAGFPRPNI